MAKWIYVAHMGEDNPICRDIGNIEKLNVTGFDSWVEIESLVVDGIEYHLGMKSSATRILGVVSLDPMYDAKSGERLTWIYPPLENAKDGMVVEVKYCTTNGPYAHRAYCDDPRLLCIVNRLWNLNLRQEYGDQEKIDKALVIPAREEALKYLREREYMPSCITDIMMHKYAESNPGWDERMYKPD